MGEGESEGDECRRIERATIEDVQGVAGADSLFLSSFLQKDCKISKKL